MSDVPERTPGGSSRALQGCLYGAVVLFIVMFLGMIYLGYLQFQSNTAPGGTRTDPSTNAPVSLMTADAYV